MSLSFISSVYGHAETELIIKKSRFIASLQEVRTIDEASAFIEQTKKKYWDARHNCYAWQLGPAGKQQKSSDDGEPSGTAGRPMLEILKKNDITNTVVVVTRYFGGIKLGASGLIRAYSQAVISGLAAASIADYKPYYNATCNFEYTFLKIIERITPEYNIIITDRDFSDKVLFHLQIPQDAIEAFQKSLADHSNGSAHMDINDFITLPIIRPQQK